MKYDVEFICIAGFTTYQFKKKTEKIINHLFCKSNIAQDGISYSWTSFPPKITTLPSLRRSVV